jgi:hypothetical protein
VSVLLVAALLLSACQSSEGPMSEIRIGENEVATLGVFKVALAKCFDDEREGKKTAVAWLSVVQKGSTEGQKDYELAVGQTLALGADTWRVAEVVVEGPGRSASVLLTR